MISPKNLLKIQIQIQNIFLAVNTETTLQETFNIAEALASPSPNTIRINKTNPNEVNVFYRSEIGKRR